ncbi:MAG: hypothetical protein Kow0074_24650 [Candidatus Zixiibacteriota bacterium]
MSDWTNRIIRPAIAVLLIWALLAPTIGEVACTDVCTGSACKSEVVVEFCETESAGGCCSPAQTGGEVVESDEPDIAVMGKACTMCPCFEDRPFEIYVFSERPDLTQRTAITLNMPALNQASVIPTHRLCAAEVPLVVAHGPPLYQKHRALLL